MQTEILVTMTVLARLGRLEFHMRYQPQLSTKTLVIKLKGGKA